MPRRNTPDPIALAVGRRIRQLRMEQGLTAESLVFEGEVGSKGFVSDIEKGLARPSLNTLQQIATYLKVALLDLVTFPDADERQALVDRTRHLPRGALRKLLKELSPPAPQAVAANPKSTAHSPALVGRGSQAPKARRKKPNA